MTVPSRPLNFTVLHVMVAGYNNNNYDNKSRSSVIIITSIRGGTIPEITMRYVSRYLSHDTIRITILH